MAAYKRYVVTMQDNYFEKHCFFPSGIWSYKWATAGELQRRKINEQMEKATNKQASQEGREYFFLVLSHSPIINKSLQLNCPCRAGTDQPQALCITVRGVSTCTMPPLVHFHDKLPPTPLWWAVKVRLPYTLPSQSGQLPKCKAGGGKMIAYLVNNKPAKLKLLLRYSSEKAIKALWITSFPLNQTWLYSECQTRWKNETWGKTTSVSVKKKNDCCD